MFWVNLTSFDAQSFETEGKEIELEQKPYWKQKFMSPVSPVFHTVVTLNNGLKNWIIWGNKTSRGPIPDRGTRPLSTKQTEDRLRLARGPVCFQFHYINGWFGIIGTGKSFNQPRPGCLLQLVLTHTKWLNDCSVFNDLVKM